MKLYSTIAMPVGEFICNLIIWDNLLSTIIKSLVITNYVNMDYIAVLKCHTDNCPIGFAFCALIIIYLTQIKIP